MAKKNQDAPNEPMPREKLSGLFTGRDLGAEQELRARHIVSTMTDAGKIRDLRNRRQLAENLGRILSRRKSKLNLSELVVAAGISENPDPARLGRFRILPGKDTDQSAVKRLSQDALAYVRLVKETAMITGENQSMLVEELVIGTRFDPSGLENVEIEPFEQLFELIQKKIDVIDAKFDLVEYFSSIRNNLFVPVWSHGPYVGNRRTSRHSGERPKTASWKMDPNLYEHDHDNWRYQAMPCVPLCRIRQPGKESVFGTVKIGEFTEEHAELDLYQRLFLGIGIFDHAYFSDPDKGELDFTYDPSPRPYLIYVQELYYSSLTDEIPFGDDGESTVATDLSRPVTGGVNDDTMPIFFYDDSSDIKIESVESHRNYAMNYLFMLENVIPLNLNRFRNSFGSSYFPFDRPGISSVFTLDDDALNTRKMGMTLAPLGSIAGLMESNLLSNSIQADDANPEDGPTFLDLLEQDAERLTSSLRKSMEGSRNNLIQQHQEILERFGREYDEAKNQKRTSSTER